MNNEDLFKAKNGDKLIKLDRENNVYSELIIKKISLEGENSLYITFEDEKEEHVFFLNLNNCRVVKALGTKYRVIGKTKESIAEYLRR